MTDVIYFGREKTEVEKIEAEFEKLHDDFEAKVQALADKKFNEIVLPFLKERGLVLFTGNGTWVITKKGETIAGDGGDETGADAIRGERRKQDADLVRIVSILGARIEGFDANSLGSLMPGNDTPRNKARKYRPVY